MGGTGEILFDLWKVSMELADELTVFGVSSCSKDTPKNLKTVDEPCCLEVPAFVIRSFLQKKIFTLGCSGMPMCASR